MYEPEVNNLLESVDSVPSAIVEQFKGLKPLVNARTVLPWGEHCTECAWPTCYTTCELYDPRSDRNCRLFVDGMVRIDIDDDLRPYLLKIRFKRWGKLWTVGNLAGYSPEASLKKERSHIMVGALARAVPLPLQLKSRVLGKVSYLRRCEAENATHSQSDPDCFLLECYNPNQEAINLTLAIRTRHGESLRAFQRVIPVPCGFVREKINLRDIRREIDLSQPFDVEIVPNDVDGTVLYFGLMDFVWLHSEPKETSSSLQKSPAWKCIVWDLDNTLWDGTLIEDGPDRLKLRHEVVEIIKETDRRGILHSVASKNNHADAMRVLQVWGLDKYFLYPQICWEPKSHSVAQIARLLNIGVDSLAFVDDQPFEREEVRSALPQVTVVDAAAFRDILLRPECQVPVTVESQQRRAMYQQEVERKVVQEIFKGDYTKFLRECQIQLVLTSLTVENLERVYELAQRTNQMNFSGARYPREQLLEIQHSKNHETYVIRCADRFGSYGIVGFAVVDLMEPRLLDLMFSCRIQGKRVEHALLAYLLERYSRPEKRDFFANFRKTKKNEKPGKVFEEVGFEVVEEKDNLLSLKFPKTCSIPHEDIIQICVD